MQFKDFFNLNSSMSSMRLSMFIIVLVVCTCLVYLTITTGIAMAGYLVASLGIGIAGKAVQRFAEPTVPQLTEEIKNV